MESTGYIFAEQVPTDSPPVFPREETLIYRAPMDESSGSIPCRLPHPQSEGVYCISVVQKLNENGKLRGRTKG